MKRPPLRGLSLTQCFASLAFLSRQGTDPLMMSGPRRVHQSKDGGMHATGKTLSPYPLTTEARLILVAHIHRLGLPDIAKTPRLTIARTCLHQGKAASSSVTTRSRPVVMESV